MYQWGGGTVAHLHDEVDHAWPHTGVSTAYRRPGNPDSAAILECLLRPQPAVELAG